MKLNRIVGLIVIMCCSIRVFAQTAQDTSTHVYESSDVKTTVLKKAEYVRSMQGKFAGYRIQISSTQDRNESNRVRNEFATKYPGIPTYQAYQQPYFRINAGDYRTKLEATKNLNLVRKSYPGAFIVKDKIYPPPLPQQQSN